MRRLLVCLLCILGLAVVPSLATAQTLHKTTGHWRVFTMEQGGEKLCYIASVPTKKTGNYKKRGEPFVIVTHRSATKDEVSASSGYPYKPSRDVTVNIDGKKTMLFTRGERAWTKDDSTDTRLVNAMKRGKTMMVRGTSKLNTFSSDTYSLKGFTSAHREMKTLCR